MRWPQTPEAPGTDLRRDWCLGLLREGARGGDYGVLLWLVHWAGLYLQWGFPTLHPLARGAWGAVGPRALLTLPGEWGVSGVRGDVQCGLTWRRGI